MDELLALAKQQGSLVLLLVLIIVTGSRGLWIWGWQHKEALASAATDYAEMKQDRDFWRTVGLRGVGAIEKAVSLAERQIPPPPP